jgi:hypothetical protein
MTDFKQGSYYELQLPVTDSDGAPVASIAAASFTAYHNGVPELDMTIGTGLTFADSVITVVLTNARTLDMVGRYDCELWVQVDDAKRVLAYDDAIYFEPTRKRT